MEIKVTIPNLNNVNVTAPESQTVKVLKSTDQNITVNPAFVPVGGGPQGEQGPEGPIGATGATGPQGPQGTTGPEGSIGATGPEGIPGVTGPQGPEGVPGVTGPQGPGGPTGATGPQGNPGENGFAAGQIFTNKNTFADLQNGEFYYEDSGIPSLSFWGAQLFFNLALENPFLIISGAGGNGGFQTIFSGNVVVSGDSVPFITTKITAAGGGTGLSGLTFTDGERYAFYFGLKGPAGDDGATGPEGPSGPVGATGLQGLSGPKGDPGPSGPVGATGVPGNKGDTGATGPHGATGPKGDLGDSVFDVWAKANPNGTQEEFFESLKGSTGPVGPAGSPAPTEVINAPLQVFVPDAEGEYIFGKLKHGDVIQASSENTKTALEIILEVLSQAGQISAPSISLSPSSVQYSTTPISGASGSITASIENVNDALGGEIIFKFYKKIGSNSFQESDVIHTQTVSGPGTVEYTHSFTYDFAFVQETPTTEHIYFKVTAEDSETGQVTESSIRSYTPSYNAPNITDFSLSRLDNASGSGESHSDRQLYNGRSRLTFRVRQDNSQVPLDQAQILKNDSHVEYVDLSSLSIINTYTTYITRDYDDGNVAISDSHTYEVKIWDDRRPYVDDNSPTCDTDSGSYTVNRINVRQVLSPNLVDDTSTDAEIQAIYDGSSGITVHGVTNIAELITASGDIDPTKTTQLQADLYIPTTQEINDYIYVFVPSYYFSGQDITGTSNPNIDFYHNGPTGTSQVIQPVGELGDYYLIKSDYPLAVQFGDETNKVNYHVLRIIDSLGSTALRGSSSYITNNE